MRDPWRQRCPKGHTSIKLLPETDSYRCGACQESYEGEPYDAKEHEFPIDEDPRPKDIHDDVLAALVRKCSDPTTTWVRARDLTEEDARRVGRILSQLEADGLVERGRENSSRAQLWRPTEAAREQVIETERRVSLDRGAKRQRAHATPTQVGILTMVIGLALLLSAVAIANGVVVG